MQRFLPYASVQKEGPRPRKAAGVLGGRQAIVSWWTCLMPDVDTRTVPESFNNQGNTQVADSQKVNGGNTYITITSLRRHNRRTPIRETPSQPSTVTSYFS